MIKILVILVTIIMIISGVMLIYSPNSNVIKQSIKPNNLLTNSTSTALDMAQYFTNIAFVNFTIPNYNPLLLYDKGYYVSSTVTGSYNDYTSVIMSRYNTFHTLGFYYINNSMDLVFYNYFSNTTNILINNMHILDFNYMSSDGYGYLNYYQNLNGSIEWLYWYGNESGYYHVYEFNLYTGILTNINTTIIFQSSIYQIEMFNSNGYLLYSSESNDTVIVFSNTGQIYKSKVANFNFPEGNSPEYVPTTNTFEESYSSGSTIYFTLAQFNTTTNTFANLTLSANTGVSSSSDVNNNPTYITTLTNGTILMYGLSMASNTVFNYNTLYIYKNITKDSMGASYYGHSLWSSELQSNNVIISQSQLIQQGSYGYPYNTVENSVFPFIYFNPINSYTNGYASAFESSNSRWFNNLLFNVTYYDTTSTGLYDIAGYNGYLNYIPTVKATNQITMYWLPQYTSLNAISTAKYNLEIKEYGLPTGKEYKFVFNGTQYNSITSEYNITLNSGSYSMYVDSIAGYSVNYKSLITINSNYIEYINFTKLNVSYYQVTFYMNGLSNGQIWTLEINGQEYMSNSNVLNLNLTNGTYYPIIILPSSYGVNDANTLIVNGNNTLFVIYAQPSNTNWIISNMQYIMVFILLFGLILIAVALKRRNIYE